MLFGDDDWLEPAYLELCLGVLRANPQLALVCGRTRYHWNDGRTRVGRTPEVLDRSPSRRVLSYYRQVQDDTGVNGLISRQTLEQVPPFRNVYGHDWQRGASIAFLGGIARVAEASLHRSRGGSSETARGAAEIMGLPAWQGRNHAASLALLGAIDIVWWSDAYSALPVWRRALLAFRCATTFRGQLLRRGARVGRRVRRRGRLRLRRSWRLVRRRLRAVGRAVRLRERLGR
jgi:hypothetical protein